MSIKEHYTFLREVRSSIAFNTEIHRFGLIMATMIDTNVYVSASVCHPVDCFNRNTALGVARKKYLNTYNSFGKSFDNKIVITNSHNFPHVIDTSKFDSITNDNALLYLGILQHVVNRINIDNITTIISDLIGDAKQVLHG